jgi:hydroxyethylthiazole kinase-like uncharacterized protein yjeF
MQRAADGLAHEVSRELDAVPDQERSVLVLVGAGNNGGDALFAAGRLADRGHIVTVAPVVDRVHAEGLEAARRAGAILLETQPDPAYLDEVIRRASASSIIVDGILGTGSAGSAAPRGRAGEIIARLARADSPRCRVVAVDIPSGVDPDDGRVPGAVLPADVTVTFGALKAGLLLPPGRDMAGEVRLIDIGLDFTGVEPLVVLD